MNKDMNKNLRDINSPLPNLPLDKGEEQGGGLSYTKTYKLITALYMVTDIIDKEEPIRHKLRTLGIEIISDTSSISRSVIDTGKIDQIVSFLNIASAMNFITEMNCAILTKEFMELKESIKGYTNTKPEWLTGFLAEEFSSESDPHPTSPLSRGRSKEGVFFIQHPIGHPKGHNNYVKGQTRIGVQKGSTLMKVLSDKVNLMSNGNIIDNNNFVLHHGGGFRSEFDVLKKQRRDSIVAAIKSNGGSASIKDIMIKINNGQDSVSCREKTLQRELMSMTKDGVLNKTGEKRWSRYFLK